MNMNQANPISTNQPSSASFIWHHPKNPPKYASFSQNKPNFLLPSPISIACIASKTSGKSNEFRVQSSLPKETNLSTGKLMQCPTCGSKEIIRKGRRELKHGEAQIYRCSSCQKHFSDKDMKHKSYPARIILNAISTYNLGYTIKQTQKEIAKRFHIRIPESTIHSWIKHYSDICTFHRLREQAIKSHNTQEIIFRHNLQHNQIYKYQLHKAKLELVKGELPEQKFQLFKAYLEKIPTDSFPHHIFQPKREELEELTRSSQIKFNTLHFIKEEKQNLSNALAALGLQLAKTNKERHEAVQNFMIANDSVTIACEVPVYLTGDDIKYFLNKGFTLPLENYQTPITGHIDVIQIRNGLIHILDYKPNADKVNAVHQLTTYALALASRTKLAVKDFKCALFDDKHYYEFFPLHAVYRRE